MIWNGLVPILAQASTTVVKPQRHWNDFSAWQDKCLLTALIALAIGSVVLYAWDSAGQKSIWRVFLPLVRLTAIVGLILILFDFHERTAEESVSPSRVVVLVDVSPSMELDNTLQDADPDSPSAKGGVPSRIEVARQLLEKSDMIQTLRERHEVHVYAFGEKLYDRIATLPVLDSETIAARKRKSREDDAEGTDDGADDEAGEDETDAEAVAEDSDDASDGDDEQPDPFELIAWDEHLELRGGNTRLGDAMRDVVREYASETFSGVVVITDGSNNAGSDPDPAKRKAMKQNIRFVTVGVGTTRRAPTIRVTNLVTPSLVRVEDPYELKAYVSGQNLTDKRVAVELLARPADAPDAELQSVSVDEGDNPVVLDLPEDGREVEIPFRRTNSVAGKLEYVVRVTPERRIPAGGASKLEEKRVVEVSDKPTGVLIVAGGPMRDYRFARNMFTRHAGIDLWVWLQTVDAADVNLVSQESNNDLLTSFPTKAELNENIDVVIGFDPDWTALSVEEREYLSEWNSSRAGGLILVAGDVHTPELVSADNSFDVVRDMYPVVLEALLLNVNLDDEDAQPWEPAFTRDAENAEFLEIADDPVESTNAWKEFEGMYRCYPTVGTKGGTVVYAHFSNPRARSAAGPHVLLASHTPGLGKVLYLGSSEIWRLRSLGEERFDNFWVKMVREASKGRLKEGSGRVMFDAERSKYFLGETVVMRARLLDVDYEPVEMESVTMRVVDPNGRPVSPDPVLRPVPKSPGVYSGTFRAAVASPDSEYTVSLQVPGASETVERSISVTVPNLETDDPQQNARLLEQLGNEAKRNFYVSLEGRDGSEGVVEAAAESIPTFFVKRSRRIVLDERRDKLWDTSLVLYLLVGLLSVEWLTRKLLKLA